MFWFPGSPSLGFQRFRWLARCAGVWVSPGAAGSCSPNALPGLRLSLQLCSGSRILCNTKGYKKKRQLLFRVFYAINIAADGPC